MQPACRPLQLSQAYTASNLHIAQTTAVCSALLCLLLAASSLPACLPACCCCCCFTGAIASVHLQGLFYHEIRATPLGRWLVQTLPAAAAASALQEAIASVRLQGLYYHEIRNTPLGRWLVQTLGPPPLGEHDGQLPVQLMRWVTLVRLSWQV
jgi:hypothetical protein